MITDYEARLRKLESDLASALSRLRKDEQAIGQALTQLNQVRALAGGGGMPGGIRLAKSGTSGIPAAASDGSPGSATVEMWLSGGGSPTDASTTATAYNWSASAVGASKRLYVAQAEDGTYYVIWESCP